MKTYVQLFLVFLFIAGCQYKYEKEATPDSGDNVGAGGGTPGAAAPGFDQIRTQVLAPRCFECHSSAGGNRGGINLETFGAVKPLAQAVAASVANDGMPLNRTPLTSQQKALLNSWVAAGAPEKPIAQRPSTPVEPIDTPPPTVPLPPTEPPTPTDPPPQDTPFSLDWATVNTLVIEPSCLGCHSEPSNRGGVNLESYKATFDEIKDVEETIRDGSMPRRSTLTPEQKKLILDWIEAGAPEFSNN